ncbi:hypothetical protein GGS26DRAFT_594767 [Hypomontagnella submonticulosa]|nr:hypothetical protein GGS26DRAFT_594767 [Hypomontagnella submonticulosa]
MAKLAQMMSFLFIASLSVGAFGTFIPYPLRNGSAPANLTTSLNGPIISSQPASQFDIYAASVTTTTYSLLFVTVTSTEYPDADATQSTSVATEFSSISMTDLPSYSDSPDSAVQNTLLSTSKTTWRPDPAEDHSSSAEAATIWPSAGALDTSPSSVPSELSTSPTYMPTTLATDVVATQSPIDATPLPVSSTVPSSSISQTSEIPVSSSQPSLSTQSSLPTISWDSVSAATTEYNGAAMMTTTSLDQPSETYSPTTTLKVNPIKPTLVMHRK